jgi:hypothetical protein
MRWATGYNLLVHVHDSADEIISLDKRVCSFLLEKKIVTDDIDILRPLASFGSLH